MKDFLFEVRRYLNLLQTPLMLAAVALTFVLFTACVSFALDITNAYFSLQEVESDIVSLEIKKSGLDSTRNLSEADIDSYLLLVNRLVPNSEDYFSVLATINYLSQVTGFQIDKYNLNVPASTIAKLNITVEGTGDLTTFLKFLDTYPYGGGRLITSDKIEFIPQAQSKNKLTLNFYHVSNQKGKSAPLTDADRKLLQEIQTQIPPLAAPSSERGSFEVKQNPF